MLSIASIALYFNSAIFDHGDDGVVGMLAAVGATDFDRSAD